MVCDVQWMLGVIFCMLFSGLLCKLEAVKGWYYLLKELEVPEVMCCVLLCILEVVEGGIYLLEMLETLEALEMVFCVLLSFP